jgi:hypothetical protein
VKLTFLDEQNGNISSRDIINDLSTVFESFESISKKKENEFVSNSSKKLFILPKMKLNISPRIRVMMVPLKTNHVGAIE